MVDISAAGNQALHMNATSFDKVGNDESPWTDRLEAWKCNASG